MSKVKALVSFLLAILVITVVQVPTWATDYYADSVLGSNDNDGLSSTSAKLTIQSAVDLASAGDTVHVAVGTYFENVTLRSAITVQGTTDGDAIIDGENAGSSPLISADHLSGLVTIRNLTIRNGKSYGIYASNSTMNVEHSSFENNADGSVRGIDAVLVLSSNRFLNNSSYCVAMYGKYIAAIGNHFTSSPMGLYLRWITNPYIDGNTFTNIGTSASNSVGSIYITEHFGDAVISNNSIVNGLAYMAGIYVGSYTPATAEIIGNTITGCQGFATVATLATSGTIAGNVITDNACGVEINGNLASTPPSFTVKDNLMCRNSEGLRIGAVQNSVINNNTFDSNTGPGITVNESDLQITDNVITNNGTPEFCGGILAWGNGDLPLLIARNTISPDYS